MHISSRQHACAPGMTPRSRWSMDSALVHMNHCSSIRLAAVEPRRRGMFHRCAAHFDEAIGLREERAGMDEALAGSPVPSTKISRGIIQLISFALSTGTRSAKWSAMAETLTSITLIDLHKVRRTRLAVSSSECTPLFSPRHYGRTKLRVVA